MIIRSRPYGKTAQSVRWFAITKGLDAFETHHLPDRCRAIYDSAYASLINYLAAPETDGFDDLIKSCREHEALKA